MKKALLTVAALLTMVLLPAGTAFAWTYGVSGKGACQPDGKYKITWTIDNSTEDQELTVKESDRSAVPVSSKVAKKSTQDFTEMVDGTKAGSFTLNLNVTWPGDMNDHKKSATVKLDQPCTQPTPPTTTQTGGKGGEVKGAQVVVAPVAVNAGEGGASNSLSAATIAGMVASVALIGVGLRTMSKQRQ